MSILFPKLYWLIVAKPESRTIYYYSCVENDFVLSNRTSNGKKYKTGKGKELSKTTYFQALPFLFFRNLVSEGTMPDSLYGVKMDPHEITMTNFNAKLFPHHIDKPDYGLYPMFESNNGISNPALPDDYFRFTKHSIEFIEADNNKVNTEKSARWTKALTEKYFRFPPKIVAGNTSIRKSVDEGYFIIDALNHFFNVKMVDGQAIVEIIPLPRDFGIKHIQCIEMRSRESLAIVISDQNRLYLLMAAGFLLEELPVDNYDPSIDKLRIQGNMFHKFISITGPSYSKNTAINNDYEFVDYIEEFWPKRNETKKGRLARTIFPFELHPSTARQGYKRLFFVGPIPFAFIVNFLFACIFYVFKRKTKAIGNPNRIIFVDTFLVLVFGVYAFIACSLIKPQL